MTDRDRILQKTNGGLDVFTHYMGNDCKKKVFRNPFRSDSSPSCHLYYNEDQQGGEGRFILKDFGDSQWKGDCFWLVGKLTGLDVRNDFLEILRTIDKECELFILDDAPAGYHPVMKKVKTERLPDNRPVKFVPKYRNFNKYELEYWQSYGITIDVLQRFGVKCLTSCYFERSDGSHYNIYGTKDIPMFAYTFNDGTGIKVYRPGAEIGRFMYAGNLPHPYIFGLSMLNKNSEKPLSERFSHSLSKDFCLFITGGEKDVMSLSARGFHAICLNSETAKLSSRTFNQLAELFPYIIFLYDCDETGVRESALRVQECCNYPKEGLSAQCKVYSIKLPLSGSKKEKDVSDFFRCGYDAENLCSLVSTVVGIHPKKSNI